MVKSKSSSIVEGDKGYGGKRSNIKGITSVCVCVCVLKSSLQFLNRLVRVGLIEVVTFEQKS